MIPAITAVICTYNRRPQLVECLASLAGQSLPPDRYEILVVDNNSTDGTTAAVADFAREHPALRVRCVREAEQGLSAARNTGVREAAAEIVAFIDNDAVAEPCWLAALVQGFERPEVMAAGGPIGLKFLAEPPRWLTPKFYGWLGRLEMAGQTAYPAEDGRWPNGGNMAFRKKAWYNVGGFNKDLGRIGTGMLSGEETLFFRNIAAQGGMILMLPAARVWHVIPASRLTKAYFIRLHEGLGVSRVRGLGPLPYRRRVGLVLRFGVEYVANSLLYALAGWGRNSSKAFLAYLYFRRSAAKLHALHSAGASSIHVRRPPAKHAMTECAATGEGFPLSISVVLPVYNRVDRIGRALDSVLTQTRPSKEIIVVDDGSTDGTPEFVAANYPLVKLIRQPHRGPGAARNAGIQAASGDLIAFLDSDDLWLPDKLRLQAEAFTRHPELGLLATRKYKNKTTYTFSDSGRPRIRFYPFTAFLKRTTVNTPTIMIPRGVFAEIGLFDESLPVSEDWDLWARIAYRYPVARVEQPLVAVFESADSISLSRRTKYFNDVTVLAHWKPGVVSTYDKERRLSPLLYQSYIVSFTILRAARLLKHEGSEVAREFVDLAEQKLGLAVFPRILIRGALRVTGLYQ